MSEVKLMNLDRLLLLPILMRAEGNILIVRSARLLVQKVGFSSEETKELGIKKLSNGGVSWEKNKELKINIVDSVYCFIKKTINDMSKQGKMNMQFLAFAENVLLKEDVDEMIKELEDKELKEEKKV